MSDVETNVIHTGDCFDVLAGLPDESVHMCMTSPPYWNLRDYDHADQLGREKTADEFVQNIADVCDEIKRVLRPDGSFWLNLGDTYDDKNKQLIPQRVAIELQSRGWILRNDATWLKPNPMPSSVKDRLNATTEKLFHLVKSKRYWYDLDAIREPHETEPTDRQVGGNGAQEGAANPQVRQDRDWSTAYHENGKNPGDVFEVATKPFPDAHFATYPPKLCEKPIKASCPGTGVVLDPFAGAGTTLLKAKELGRQFVGIELNPKYADMARARVGIDVDDPSNVRNDADQHGLEAYEVEP